MLRSRYRRILLFFVRVLLSVILWDLFYPRIGLGTASRRNRSKRLRDYAIGFRKMSVEMGGVLIKVGQFLSSRVDVLPLEITGELSELQDEVPPEKFENIRQVAEAELGMPLRSKYLSFDEEPIAAASLGQAHHATLRNTSSEEYLDQASDSSEYRDPSVVIEDSFGDGEIIDVIVKIQRKNIELLIATDLAALRTVGNWLQRYRPIRRRANVPALLDEFTRTLYEEIDYLAEGRNAEIFATNFKKHTDIIVPKVIWSHTTKRVLTLEDVRGIKINNYEEMTAAGIDRKEVASRLMDTYLKQIFEDGFFHADPHPGNLFVTPCMDLEEADCVGHSWKLTFVDFGMVGRLTPKVFDGMRDLLIAVGTRDARGVLKASEKLGFILPGADLTLLEKAEAKLFDRFWGKSMKELTQIDPSEMFDFAREFRQIIYILPFQIPQDVLFLGRALGILSGMCMGLNPYINIWDHLVPYARKLMTEEMYNPERLLDMIGTYLKRIIGLPARIESVIDKLELGEISVRELELSLQVRRMENTIRQLIATIMFFAFFISGILFYLQGISEVSYMLITLSIIIFFIFSLRKTD